MLTLVVAAIAVGLGNFGAAIGIGLTANITAAARMRVGAVFGVFEAGMPLIGLLVGDGVTRLIGRPATYAGGGLLVVIGIWQLFQAARNHDKESTLPAGMWQILLAGLALSVDNLVIGFTLGAEHSELAETIVVFGIVSVVLTLLGLELGRRLGRIVGFGVEYLAGVMLIGVGVLVGVGVL